MPNISLKELLGNRYTDTVPSFIAFSSLLHFLDIFLLKEPILRIQSDFFPCRQHTQHHNCSQKHHLILATEMLGATLARCLMYMVITLLLRRKNISLQKNFPPNYVRCQLFPTLGENYVSLYWHNWHENSSLGYNLYWK